MRAVQITRFGGPEVLEVVDLPEPEAGDGQKLYDVSTAGINYADTHHPVSADSPGAPASRLHPGAEQNGPAVPPARGSGTSSHCAPRRKHLPGSRCSPVVLNTEGGTRDH